jgi:TonB family protein
MWIGFGVPSKTTHQPVDKRMKRCSFLVFTAMLAIPPALPAQEPMSVDASTFNQHRIHAVPLVYPPIAKAAQVQGTVVVEVTVDDAGKVKTTKVLSGPPMLLQAAVDCVKQWTWRPFEKEGVPVPAVGQVSLEFTLGEIVEGHGPPSLPPAGSRTFTIHVTAPDPNPVPDQSIAQAYFKAFHDCLNAISAQPRDDAAAAACRQAADLAATFPPGQRFIERRSSDVYAASALSDSGDFNDALTYANRAVAVVQLGHDDNSGKNAAYFARANAEELLGDLRAADHDLTVAEKFERKGIAWAVTSPFLEQNYRQVLKQQLGVHADILIRLGRSQEAQAKLDEAEKL